MLSKAKRLSRYLNLVRTKGIGFFDKEFYLKAYPDVAASGMNPLVHYLEYGISEKRLPKASPILQPITETDANELLKNQSEFETFELSYPVKISVKNPVGMKSFILENNGKTEFINTYFDHIYVINLRRRQNKLIEILQKLRKYNIRAEIIEAVDGYLSPHVDEYQIYQNLPLGLDNAHPRELKANRKLIGSPGVWGHLKSNRLILNDASKKGYRRILILEDDALFIHNFHEEFQQFTNQISDINWKILCLGASQHFWEAPDNLVYPDNQQDKPYYHPVFTFGSFALGIYHTQFKPMIFEIDKMNCAFDATYHTIFQQFTKDCLVALPNLIASDIAESDTNANRVYTDQHIIAAKLRWDLSKYDYPFQKELVSIIVPAYNAENTIEFSLKSLLSQSYSGLEIIVLDDASTDGTEKIVRRMAAEDSRIRCIRFEENRGCYVMMNAGIRASKGSIIALQGADDISMPERIARQILPILAGRVQITIAKLIRSHCSIEEFSIENAEELRKRAERKQLIDENGIYQAANQAEICLASTVALKSVFEKYGLFWEGRYSCDTEFWERIIFREHNIRVPENADNVKQYIAETRYAESLFEVVDDVLYLSPERNEFNLTVKYPLGGEQRINFRKTYRNRLIGIGDYQYPTL